jgi:hypothetical protein
MTSAPLHRGYYFNALTEGVARKIDGLCKRLDGIEGAGVGQRAALRLSEIKRELGAMRAEMPEAPTSRAYNRLFMMDMRLGEMEGKLSEMEFSGHLLD